jgi:hypothetical protein
MYRLGISKVGKFRNDLTSLTIRFEEDVRRLDVLVDNDIPILEHCRFVFGFRTTMTVHQCICQTDGPAPDLPFVYLAMDFRRFQNFLQIPRITKLHEHTRPHTLLIDEVIDHLQNVWVVSYLTQQSHFVARYSISDIVRFDAFLDEDPIVRVILDLDLEYAIVTCAFRVAQLLDYHPLATRPLLELDRVFQLRKTSGWWSRWHG